MKKATGFDTGGDSTTPERAKEGIRWEDYKDMRNPVNLPGEEIEPTNFTSGHIYMVVDSKVADRDTLVLIDCETGLGHVLSEGALLCQKSEECNEEAYKPFTKGECYPACNSPLMCVSTDPLLFSGTIEYGAKKFSFRKAFGIDKKKKNSANSEQTKETLELLKSNMEDVWEIEQKLKERQAADVSKFDCELMKRQLESTTQYTQFPEPYGRAQISTMLESASIKEISKGFVLAEEDNERN